MTVKLTQTVQKGGCAAKVAAVELRKILQGVEFPPRGPEIVVGAETFDDAAIVQLTPEISLVQTLDFFTPIVDDPFTFGKIAAANALSDVYAMGGTPKTALAIFAFPLESFDNEVGQQVLQGACEALKEAKTSLVGGHTIDDETMKFGLSVTGLVHPQKVWTNAQARAGDTLILTKAIGTGTMTAALKRGEVDESGIREALDSMAQVNRVPEVLGDGLHSAVHAATDITGFGLAGHAFNMAKASEVSLRFDSARIPKFSRALEFIQKGFLTKAHRTNREYLGNLIQFQEISPEIQQLFFDPQTSGGLLMSVDAAKADLVVQKLKSIFPMTTTIGKVEKSSEKSLWVQ